MKHDTHANGNTSFEISIQTLKRGRDSSVDIMTGYGLYD
jgi:hypothetical protein